MGNTPNIRFKGFTNDWEQRKVSELSEKTFGGGTPKTSNDSFWKGNIPWIQSSDLVEGSLFDVEPRKYISQEAVDKSATKLVPEKSVAIVTRVGVGKLAFMPFSYATSQDFLSLSVLKTEPQFTVYALYKKLQSELNDVQGTSIKGVTKDELLAKEVMIPCYKEQEKIGSYLHSLDHLITLHQRKLFLNFVKKNDWEQRKLGEVFQEYSEKNHPELPALTIIQGGGTVLREESERKLQYDKSSLAGYKMVREDDFIVHLRSFEGGLEKSNHNGLISPAYHTFHGDEVDSRFYYPYFRSYEFIKHKLVPHVYGIRDGRSIDIDGMKTIEIPWTLYEEQKKIGDYIESLDTLITLHRRAYYNKKGGLTNVHNDNQQHYAIL